MWIPYSISCLPSCRKLTEFQRQQISQWQILKWYDPSIYKISVFLSVSTFHDNSAFLKYLHYLLTSEILCSILGFQKPNLKILESTLHNVSVTTTSPVFYLSHRVLIDKYRKRAEEEHFQRKLTCNNMPLLLFSTIAAA